MAAFLLSLREGLEGALIVGILLGTVRRLAPQEPSAVRAIWLGTGAAAAVSLLLALVLGALRAELAGASQAVFEGITVLLAAAVLTWMIFWMQGQGQRMGKRLAGEVQQATEQRTPGPAGAIAGRLGTLGLFSVAFFAVAREGLELALFLAAALFATSAGQTLLGALLGLAAAAALGALLFAGTIRLSLQRFFLVTSSLLILFAAGMVAYGVHELVEGGLLPGIIQPLWNTGHWLGEDSLPGQLLRTLFGYHSDPSLAEVLAYIGYYLAIAAALFWRHAHRPQMQHAPAKH